MSGMKVELFGRLWDPGYLDSAVESALGTVSPDAVSMVRSDTPIRTKRLWNSVSATPSRTKLTMLGKAPYASFVEYGTYKMQAREMFGRNTSSIQESIAAALLDSFNRL